MRVDAGRCSSFASELALRLVMCAGARDVVTSVDAAVSGVGALACVEDWGQGFGVCGMSWDVAPRICLVRVWQSSVYGVWFAA
jgi:hypothetical protein